MLNKRISERCDCCKVPRNINMSAVNKPINFLVVVSIAAAFFNRVILCACVRVCVSSVASFNYSCMCSSVLSHLGLLRQQSGVREV